MVNPTESIYNSKSEKYAKIISNQLNQPQFNNKNRITTATSNTNINKSFTPNIRSNCDLDKIQPDSSVDEEDSEKEKDKNSFVVEEEKQK